MERLSVICFCSLPKATRILSAAAIAVPVAKDNPVRTVARTVVAKSVQALSPLQN